MQLPHDFNRYGAPFLPGHLGIVFHVVTASEVRAEMAVRQALMAPNGFLHAGAVVALADSCAGYGCIKSLPEGASGFTTISSVSNTSSTIRPKRVSPTCMTTMQA